MSAKAGTVCRATASTASRHFLLKSRSSARGSSDCGSRNDGLSDDRGVANLGHHARHHVIEVVAVKRPAAGIVVVKGDGDAAHRGHQDCIAYGTCERGTVYRDHLKSVAMKVHRVRHQLR